MRTPGRFLPLLALLAAPAFGQSWEAESPPPVPPGPGVASALQAGFSWLLPAGGTPSFLRYDPAADAWLARADLPEPAQAGAGLAESADGLSVYAMPGGASAALYKYSIAADGWSALPPSPVAVSDGSALARSGPDLFLLSGGSDKLYRFDTAGAAWIAASPLPVIAGPGTEMAALPDGRLLALPGGQAFAYRYDPGSDSWAVASPVPEAAGPGASLAIDADGRPFFYPGDPSVRLFTASPSIASWTPTTPPPGLPANPTELLVAADRLFFVASGGMESRTADPSPCNCRNSSDFAGCGATGRRSAFPCGLGILLLAYLRFRSVAS